MYLGFGGCRVFREPPTPNTTSRNPILNRTQQPKLIKTKAQILPQVRVAQVALRGAPWLGEDHPPAQAHQGFRSSWLYGLFGAYELGFSVWDVGFRARGRDEMLEFRHVRPRMCCGFGC